MSRAFVRESDQDSASEAYPERPISPHPNLVTPEGMKQIEARVRELDAERQLAKAKDDAMELARVERDLRYWAQRQRSARVIVPQPNPDAVRFGVRVTLQFEDGEQRSFRLVGEDEADPPNGLLSWVSPIAQSLTGKEIGDTVEVLGRRAEIVKLDV